MYKLFSMLLNSKHSLLKAFSLNHSGFVLFIILLSSCTVSKSSYYFKEVTKDSSITSVLTPNFDLKIKKQDMLSIYILSVNKEEDEIYNAVMLTGSGTADNPQANGYIVDKDGNITLHKLGKVRAEGLTLNELSLKIKNSLAAVYLKEPIVTVKFVNHRVTVLGEVNAPKIITLDHEDRISILDALTLAGSVTDFADNKNIVVIRDSAGQTKQFKHLNLENASVFSTPWYYLQPNDVLLVASNNKKEEERRSSRTQQYLSSGLAALSILVLVIDRITKK